MYYTLLSVLHVAVLVAVALRLFSRRNTNGSAMAWLMLVILVPLVGVLMYLLIAGGADLYEGDINRGYEPYLGENGALWVVDMYRYMIEHPDWLPPEGDPVAFGKMLREKNNIHPPTDCSTCHR